MTTAWILWAGFYVAAVLITLLATTKKTLGPCYRFSAVTWFESRDIYQGASGEGFLYLPSAALLYAPVAYLPEPVTESLWRIFTVGVFAAGVCRFASLAGRDSGRQLFVLVSLVAIPLSWSSARNGQMTLPLAGFMMLSTVDAVDGLWWRSTLWASLALACKPHAIVLLLLAAALHKPLRWRLALGVAAVILVPFATQHPAYVADQYVKFVSMLRGSIGLASQVPHAHLFGLIEVAGLRVPQGMQTLARLAAAGLTLAACHLARRRYSAAQAGMLMFTYAVCYLMLFNPRTENNTYSALAPALGVCFAQAVLVRGSRIEAAWLLVLAAGILGTYEIGRLFSPPSHAIWLAPLACACFSIGLVWRLLADAISTSQDPHPVENLPCSPA